MSAGNPLLVREFDEAIDVLEAALRRCPEALWEASLWKVERTEPGEAPKFINTLKRAYWRIRRCECPEISASGARRRMVVRRVEE